MYNRYIPQSDGSYQRSRMPDKAKPRQASPERRCPPQPQPAPTCPPPPPPRPCRERTEIPSGTGVGSFLKNLLPKDFDTEDLLVILMFLLMSRDCEDQNSALLTLALYLFL